MYKLMALIFYFSRYCAHAFDQGPDPFISLHSSEAIIEFSGALKHQFNVENPDAKTIYAAIEKQLMFMVGPMSMAAHPAVPKGDHQITHIKKLSQKGNILTLTYRYRGKAIIAEGPEEYDIILPFSYQSLYEKSMQGKTNPCSDLNYNTKDSFWYFWSPFRPGCKMAEDEDFYIAKAKVTRLKNTQGTFPEYQNLPDKNGNISIHIFFGMNVATGDGNPEKSADINATNYREFKTFLLKKGYKTQLWTRQEIKKLIKNNYGKMPYVETIRKGKIVYRLFFGPTEVTPKAQAFHWFYKDALENASAMFYLGHSGLGQRLVISTIEKLLGEKIYFNKNKYQIFFINGCTSYRYYSDMYLSRKKSPSDPRGTKKLDLVMNGLFTYFDYMNTANFAFAKAIENAVRSGTTGKGFTSFQELVEESDTKNLFAIIGDEDNLKPVPIYR